MSLPMPTLLRADARALPLADESVDLIVTSPPYFALRDYGVSGQIGGEPTAAEFLDSLVACTREMARVLKPTGSIFVNLGDKYVADARGPNGSASALTNGPQYRVARHQAGMTRPAYGMPKKSLMLLPHRYAIRCTDDLGLICRQDVVWSKPTALPEPVTDRTRRSHEYVFHLVKQPRYFAAIDEVREPHTGGTHPSGRNAAVQNWESGQGARHRTGRSDPQLFNARGRTPGSVWTIASQALNVPADVGVDHFAAFPMELPRRAILGWSPREVCTCCGQGRRPITESTLTPYRGSTSTGRPKSQDLAGGRNANGRNGEGYPYLSKSVEIVGYGCACLDASAPSTPGVVLDPFGGTGTTALVATMLGRRGISVELSHDYQRIATWRAAEPKERARAAGLDREAVAAIRPEAAGQLDLLGEATA